MGIRKVRLFNEALLEKCLWRFGMKRVALWRQAIEVNMAVDGVVGVLGLLMVHMFVGLWKNISQGWPSLSRYIL